MTVDATFFATVDPATLLFTSALADEPLRSATSQFLDNEFGRIDVNKFAELAAAPSPVSSLDRVTRGDRPASHRYREVMAPLRLGDELRAALVAAGRCWGVLCLHREASPFGFTDREIRLVQRLGPHLAEGLRRALLATPSVPIGADSAGPGVIVLDRHRAVASISPEAEHWLSQLSGVDWPASSELPIPVYAVAAGLSDVRRVPEAGAPALRVRTRSGQWLTIHASTLTGPSGVQTAVVLAPTTPRQLNSLLLDVHGLTPAQQRVTELVLRGRSTRQIVRELHISAYTVRSWTSRLRGLGATTPQGGDHQGITIPSRPSCPLPRRRTGPFGGQDRARYARQPAVRPPPGERAPGRVPAGRGSCRSSGM